MCSRDSEEIRDSDADFSAGRDDVEGSSIAIDDFLARHLTESLPRTAAEAIEALKYRGESVALAESCTGGLLASSMASVPGASDVLNSSAVVYQTRAKSTLLGLDADFVNKFGPVSSEVTAALAEAARLKNSAGLGVAVTGWAGPSGGTESDPVGTCYIAISSVSEITCFRLVIEGDRTQIRCTAACAALKLMSKKTEHSLLRKEDFIPE